MFNSKLPVIFLLSFLATISSAAVLADKRISCGRICKIQCNTGLKMDKNGCSLCQCNDPCEKTLCNDGMHCELRQVHCFTTPCPPQPMCVDDEKECGALCEIYCPYGNKMDENNCPICECQDACVAIRCHSDFPYCYDGECHANPQILPSSPATQHASN